MKILALDTSTEYCSVALALDGEIDAWDAFAGQTHSELLLRIVDEQLRKRGLRVGDLDGIAYGEGPGSFTGLRIACGVVQGLAFGADLPAVGIGTLLAMAEGSAAERVVCAIDARMKEIYYAAYVREGGGWRMAQEPMVVAPQAAPALSGDRWLACGSGFAAYAEVLQARYAGQLARIEPKRFPHARDIARLALPRFAAGETCAADDVAPVYIRNKVALRSDERASR